MSDSLGHTYGKLKKAPNGKTWFQSCSCGATRHFTRKVAGQLDWEDPKAKAPHGDLHADKGQYFWAWIGLPYKP